MQYDTFFAGVEPGGLRTKQDIKILICYILASTTSGISKQNIVSILQENGLANYFEASEAFADLVSNGNIKLEEGDEVGSYCVTDTGRIISDQLHISLPRTVRERALSAAMSLLSRLKLEKENKVDIEKISRGYNVTCTISGGEFNLMSFTMYVPDMAQAKIVKENFYKDPTSIYNGILGMLTQNKELVEESLEFMS